MLVNRSRARILRGTAERLREVERLMDDFRADYEVSGGSQDKARGNGEHAREHEVEMHLERVGEVLFRRFKAASFDRLVIGAPQEAQKPRPTSLPLSPTTA